MTPDTLFRRAFRLTVQDKEFGSVGVQRPLAFQFSVQRDKTITPNNCNILIYNLAEDTRAHLEQLSAGFLQGSDGKAIQSKSKKPVKGIAIAPQDAGVTVRLEVGYGDNLGQIFFGVLRKVSSWKQGAEWVTQISGGDAEHSILTAQISKTFPKGTPLSSVVRALVGALPGVGPGSLNNTLTALDTLGMLSGDRKLPRALTFHGDAATALEQFMQSCGFEWSIHDGAFYAGPAGTATVPGEGPLLTPETGLVEVPKLDKKGRLVGKALLNPDLLPGRVFRVESTRVTGNFLCTKTMHTGSSFDRDWYVSFVGTPPEKGSAAAGLV